MLGGLKTADRQVLIDYMTRDWSENLYPGPRNAEGREELEQHLAAMLDLETGRAPPRFSSTARWSKRRRHPRPPEHRGARARQSRGAGEGEPASRTGPPARLAARTRAVVFEPSIDGIKIPWFLTKAGFADFTAAAPGVVDEVARDRWVLGAAGQTPAISAQYDHLARRSRRGLRHGFRRRLARGHRQTEDAPPHRRPAGLSAACRRLLRHARR